MKLVIIESPYRGEVERNFIYAKRCLHDSLSHGEAPIASHLLYTQILDDNDLLQRRLGIAAGLAWKRVAELTVFYTDYGMSLGMEIALLHANADSRPIEYRTIGVN